MTPAFLAPNPLELEVRPGVKVGDLKTPLECEEAMHLLDAERQTILGQIARDEAQPGNRPPGWRASAQGALRWKKRIRAAVYARWQLFHANAGPVGKDRDKVLLDYIRERVGDATFERFVHAARARRPDVFGEGGDHA